MTLADLKDFTIERYALNSRVVKEGGVLAEQVYRAGTPDGKVPPGLYAKYLRKSIDALEKARAYAEPAQAKVISQLILYFQTGEYKDWVQFNADWVQDHEPVDFRERLPGRLSRCARSERDFTELRGDPG